MIDLDADMWLAQRLAQHLGRHPIEIVGQVFGGTTGQEERRERLRAIILSHKLSAVIVGRRDGKPETYAQHFARRYGRALVPIPNETLNSEATV